MPSSTIRFYPRAATLREPDSIKHLQLKTPASARRQRGRAARPQEEGGAQAHLKPDHEDHNDNPAALDFNDMYRQLELWRMRYGDTHVPRFVHDNPTLGHWVKYVRRCHKHDALPRWQVDQLNALDFVWRPAKQEAAWYFFYHELRRFKQLHGHTDVAQYAGADSDFLRLRVWVGRQALVFAKGKLPEKRQSMLRRLGVKLRVDLRLVKRYATLQGLNATERRAVRKGWKRQRLAESERWHAAREAEQALQQEEELAQQEQQARRRLLLQVEAVQAETEQLVWLNGMPLTVPAPGSRPAAAEQPQRHASPAADSSDVFEGW